MNELLSGLFRVVFFTLFLAVSSGPAQAFDEALRDLASRPTADPRDLAAFAIESGISPQIFCATVDEMRNTGTAQAWVVAQTASQLFFKAMRLEPEWCESFVSEPSDKKKLISLQSRLNGATKAWAKEVYNIDGLKIYTYINEHDINACYQGSEVILSLTGVIGPDSSFAMSRLLERLPRCLSRTGAIRFPLIVMLSSNGGLLEDGYSLGKELRKRQVTTVIENGSYCASSCAVAYLGGTARHIQSSGTIMFHGPYFSGKNEYGQRDIDCDVGEQSLNELKDYYVSMTDKEVGERLFERTMWYCSANDGWVVTGGAAAELYGIATER